MVRGVVETGERLGIDMVAEPKHPDDGVEVAAPLGVVAGEEVQRDWNMAADVDGLQHRRGDGGRWGRHGHHGRRRQSSRRDWGGCHGEGWCR